MTFGNMRQNGVRKEKAPRSGGTRGRSDAQDKGRRRIRQPPKLRTARPLSPDQTIGSDDENDIGPWHADCFAWGMVIIAVRDALLALAIATTIVLTAHIVGLAAAFARLSEPVEADAELCMTCVCADGACTP